MGNKSMLFYFLLILYAAQGQLDCQTCMIAAGALQYLLSNSLFQGTLKNYLIDICQKTTDPNYCNTIGSLVLGEVADVLQRRFVNGIFLCSRPGICNSAEYILEDFESWAKNALKNTPDYQIPIRSLNYLHFAQISDIRLDRKYISGASNLCSSGPCCRKGTPKNTSDTAGPNGDYNCELPLPTLRKALDSISQNNPDFIIWNGNSVAHDLLLSSSDRLNVIKNVTQEILNKFNSYLTPVFPIFGPLDCYPEHQYDFSADSYFLKSLTNLWSIWLGKQGAAQFAEKGVYSVQYKNTNLRIIGLNTLSCDINNFYLFANVTDPNGYILWLNNELANAEMYGYKVYIIGNIAPGSKSCVNSWSKHYSVLMERYQNTVMGQFFGGENRDEFRINKGYFSSKPTGIQFISPSLSPYKNSNPSYRIYQADALSKVIINYTQYRLNLTEAKPSFFQAYDFLSFYKVENMLPPTILNLSAKIKKYELLMMKYVTNKYTNGPDTPLGCKAQCLNDFYCEITNDRQEEVEKCQGIGESIKEFLLNSLYGKWTYIVER
ncbi:unnamed protein product [Blepharisma stoltei]|uniref:Sphingomyelin phosphodiesterase n=1 Tax=Blepharisma stoltei TaxID=1481888 RepID=A0AAU9J943_9CILI|nr:unnamed protein product [Blepharisma stoltei]